MDSLTRPRGLMVAALAVTSVLAAVSVAACGSEGTESVPAESTADILAWTAGKLLRVDPLTLEARGGAISIDLGAAGFSPDGNTLAVAGANVPSIRLVDLRRMQVAGRGIDLKSNAFVDTMHWLDARTIAVVTWGDHRSSWSSMSNGFAWSCGATWAARSLPVPEPQGPSFCSSGPRIASARRRWSWSTPIGGFTPGGERHFGLFPSRHVGHVETAGRYAYVTSRGTGVIDVVDSGTGRIVATVRTAEHVFIVKS